jgi:hypothetical protein
MNSLPKLTKKHQEEIGAWFDTLGRRIFSRKDTEEILIRRGHEERR